MTSLAYWYMNVMRHQKLREMQLTRVLCPVYSGVSINPGITLEHIKTKSIH